MKAKERIDTIGNKDLMSINGRLSCLKNRSEQLKEAGRILCGMWIMHWTSDDAEYLMKRAGVRILTR